TDSNNTNNYSITAWQSFDSGISAIRRDQNTTYTVTAQHPYGLNRAEIYVNGSLMKTCTLYQTSANQTCSYVLYGSNYSAGSIVSVNAKIVGRDGENQQLWTPVTSLSITDTGSTGTTGTVNLPGSISVTTDHANGYTGTDLVTFTVTAADQNGIDRIDLMVEGQLVKTCSNTGTCSWTGGPYASTNYVSYGATVVDKAGYAIWTGYMTIKKI
ncbi:MAG: Ig-like domain-containing protein, partial [Patescibacteria group bacterium]